MALIAGGTAAGAKLPTVYMYKGAYRPAGLTDEQLESWGNAPGSTILCSPTGYVIKELWVKAALIYAKAIRALPVVRDHPLWWFRLHLDGLTVHESLFKANEIFSLMRILLVIENSHSSHVNQAYDDAPARARKEACKQFVPEVRDRLGITVHHEMTQEALLKVLACLDVYVTGDVWVRGFKAVNLHPKYMVPIEVWLSKISEHLVAAEALKADEKRETKLQALQRLTPRFWKLLSIRRKKRLLRLLSRSWFEFDGKCLRKLHRKYPEVKVKSSNLWELARFAWALNDAKDAGLLPRRAVDPRIDPTVPPPLEPPHAGKDDYSTAPVFCVKPTYRPGTDANDQLFRYRVADTQQWWRNYARFQSIARDVHVQQSDLDKDCARAGHGFVSQVLDVAVSPEQLRVLRPTEFDLRLGELMKEAREHTTLQHFPRRRMNMLGEFRGEAFMANSPERLRRMRARLNIVEALRQENALKAKTLTEKQRKEGERAIREKRREGAENLLQEGKLIQRGDRVTKGLLLEFLKRNNISMPDIAKPDLLANLLPFFSAMWRFKTEGKDNWVQLAQVEMETSRHGSRPQSGHGAVRRAARRASALNGRRRRARHRGAMSDEGPGSDNSDGNHSDTQESDPGVDVDEDGEELHIVEKIVDEKEEQGEQLYKVRWFGYGSDEDTWESAGAFCNGDDFIAKYKQTKILSQTPLEPRPPAAEESDSGPELSSNGLEQRLSDRAVRARRKAADSITSNSNKRRRH